MLNRQGWIKIHRQILNNPIVTKDGDHFAVWVFLLLEAQHKPYNKTFRGEKITLEAGQLITGRKVISATLGINESKVFRVLKALKSEQQIEQQTSNKSSMITILNWSRYQVDEQQIEQQVNNSRTTNEQQVNTLQECKTVNNDIKNIVDYLNLKSGKSFKYSTSKTKTAIQARINDGFTFKEFECVIDLKVSEWSNTEMEKYIRPETLFGSKFDGYLNESPNDKKAQLHEHPKVARAMEQLEEAREEGMQSKIQYFEDGLKAVKEKYNVK